MSQTAQRDVFAGPGSADVDAESEQLTVDAG